MGLFTKKVNESAAALAEIQASFQSVSAELDSARAELKDAQELAATHLAEFTRVHAENVANIARISELEADIVEVSRESADFDARVAASAASAIATMGHAPLDIVEDEEASVDVVATFKSLKGRELSEYYNTHRKEIFEALRK